MQMEDRNNIAFKEHDEIPAPFGWYDLHWSLWLSLQLLSVELATAIRRPWWGYILEWGSPSSSLPFSSVTQSSQTLCDPMNHSTPGLPVHHQLPESTQTHVHCVGDAIQPSHPLSSPSSPAWDNQPDHMTFRRRKEHSKVHLDIISIYQGWRGSSNFVSKVFWEHQRAEKSRILFLRLRIFDLLKLDHLDFFQHKFLGPVPYY